MRDITKIAAMLLIMMALAIRACAQTMPIPINGVNYKASHLDTYLYKEVQSVVETDIIFEFRDDRINTTNTDNTKTLYIDGDFMDDVLIDYPVKKVQVTDKGGFDLVVVLLWDPEEEVYYIILSYNNVDLLYTCVPTEEGVPTGYEPLPNHEMFDGDYTAEEMAMFVKFLVYWGVTFEF